MKLKKQLYSTLEEMTITCAELMDYFENIVADPKNYDCNEYNGLLALQNLIKSKQGADRFKLLKLFFEYAPTVSDYLPVDKLKPTAWIKAAQAKEDIGHLLQLSASIWEYLEESNIEASQLELEELQKRLDVIS